MNILIVDYEYPPVGGGGGIVTRSVAEAFAKNDHQVFVVTMRIPGLLSYEEINCVKIYRVRSLRKSRAHCPPIPLYLFPIFSLLRILRICLKNKIAVINAHFVVPSGPSSLIAAKVFKIPLFTNAIGADIYDPTRYKKQRFLLDIAVKFVLNNSRLVFCLSSDMVDRVEKLTKTNIKLVPQSVDTSIFYPRETTAIKAKLGIQSDGPIVLTLARLVKRKSIETALRAVVKVIRSFPELTYIVVGEGPDKERLQQITQDLGISKNVLFAGRISDDDLPACYSLADVFVLSSLHEAFGIVILESMACGTPVVVSEVGGMIDLVEEGVTGFLCPIGDVDAFSNRIQGIISDSDLLRKMSDSARTQVAQKYSPDAIFKQYKAYFENIIETP